MLATNHGPRRLDTQPNYNETHRQELSQVWGNASSCSRGLRELVALMDTQLICSESTLNAHTEHTDDSTQFHLD